MNITIITPLKEIYNGPITSVKVPGTEGEFQVLKNHASLVSSLTEGKVHMVKENGEKLDFDIEKGYIEVLNNEVALLVQGVTHIEQG